MDPPTPPEATTAAPVPTSPSTPTELQHPFFDFTAINQLIAEKVAAIEQMRATPRYADRTTFFAKLHADFCAVTDLISFYSLRNPTSGNWLTIACFNDINHTLTGIEHLFKSELYPQVRRECRYLLELIVKLLIVDQENPTATREER